jgi:hypothetical protein
MAGVDRRRAAIGAEACARGVPARAAARAGAGFGTEGASIKISAATVAKPTTIATMP